MLCIVIIHVTGETAFIPGEISSSSDDDATMEIKETNKMEELTLESSLTYLVVHERRN
jgi:hypothetical protein